MPGGGSENLGCSSCPQCLGPNRTTDTGISVPMPGRSRPRLHVVSPSSRRSGSESEAAGRHSRSTSPSSRCAWRASSARCPATSSRIVEPVAILKAQVLLDLSDNGLLERHGLPPTLDEALASIGLTPAVLEDLSAQLDAEAACRATRVVRESPRVGRNDACPCGSGRKFKRCCGAQ